MNDDRNKQPNYKDTEAAPQDHGSKGGQSSVREDEAIIGSTKENEEKVQDEDLDTF